MRQAIAYVRRQELEIRLRLIQRHVQADPSKALLLFASPRGGSTWLEEMLATIPRTATIWEPLELDEFSGFRKLGFAWRQHIPEAKGWPEAEELFRKLFGGKVLTSYLAQATTPTKLCEADRLIVKFVRGHLLLPWLVARFALPKPVFLVRHPCAVVASMMKFGAWKAHPIPAPPPTPHRHDGLMNEYHQRAAPINTMEEYLAYIWCCMHAYLLHHPLNDKAWTTVTYEELLLHTKATLHKIFNAWGMEVPHAALQMATQPSRTTRPGSPTQDPMQQLVHWQQQLGPEQKERILKMLERFGIGLYGPAPFPNARFTPV